jgi:hypothetical protein
MAGLGLLLSSAAGHAQTIGERVDALEKKMEEGRAGVARPKRKHVPPIVDVGWV